MSRVVFALAEEYDEADLLRIMAEIAMPGNIQIAYRREPSFRDALCVQGRITQTIVGRSAVDGRVVGMGTRCIKPAYINGQRSNVGHLGNLRVDEHYRGMVYLARGYKALKQQHQDGQAKVYLSSMLNDNVKALKLTTGRASLPVYHDIGRIQNAAISLSQQPPRVAEKHLSICEADATHLAQIMDFLNSEGRKRQFFPCYSEDDILDDRGLLRGLALGDIVVASCKNQIVGVVAAWDQRAFRRSVVAGYSSWLKGVRPLYNIWARAVKMPILPREGETLKYCYLSLVCIRGDEQEVFLQLLAELMCRKREQFSFLMAGLHKCDPLLPALAHVRSRMFSSHLFCVCWEDGEQVFASLDGRCPYIELGSL